MSTHLYLRKTYLHRSLTHLKNKKRIKSGTQATLEPNRHVFTPRNCRLLADISQYLPNFPTPVLKTPIRANFEAWQAIPISPDKYVRQQILTVKQYARQDKRNQPQNTLRHSVKGWKIWSNRQKSKKSTQMQFPFMQCRKNFLLIRTTTGKFTTYITKHPQKRSTHPNAKSEKEANEQRRSPDPHAEKPNLFTFPHKLLTESSARNHKTGKCITNNCNCFTKPVKH